MVLTSVLVVLSLGSPENPRRMNRSHFRLSVWVHLVRITAVTPTVVIHTIVMPYDRSIASATSSSHRAI